MGPDVTNASRYHTFLDSIWVSRWRSSYLCFIYCSGASSILFSVTAVLLLTVQATCDLAVGELVLDIPWTLTLDRTALDAISPFVRVTAEDWSLPEEPFMLYWSWLLRQPHDSRFSVYLRKSLLSGYYCPDPDDPVPVWAGRLAPRIDCSALPYFTGTSTEYVEYVDLPMYASVDLRCIYVSLPVLIALNY
jgi:hypothetical protein